MGVSIAGVHSTMASTTHLAVLVLSCVILTFTTTHAQRPGTLQQRAASVYDLRYGVDLFLDSKTLRLRAGIGDNVTAIVEKFLIDNSISHAPTAALVDRMLRQAGGSRCDACKTMVEHLHVYLRDVSMKARPQGQDSLNKERVTFDEEQEKAVASTVCQGKSYVDYSDSTRDFCMEQLGGPNRKPVMRRWEGEKLEDSHLPQRKNNVCTELLQVCPPLSVRSSRLPERCEACMEAFQTLEFTMGRDSNKIRLGGSIDPLSFGKVKKQGQGYGSSLHAALRVEELCGELHKSFSGSTLENIQETCEEIVSDHESEVKRAFITANEHRESLFGAGRRVRVRDVCVEIAGACRVDEFDRLFPNLRNFHANITSVVKSPPPRRAEL